MKNKIISWFLRHSLTIASCALITGLGIAFLVWSSPGTTTIGENISTGQLTTTGTTTLATTEGNVGIGTTTPATTLQVADTASSTVMIGESGKTGCLILADSDGVGVTYITANEGVLTATTTKPDICK